MDRQVCECGLCIHVENHDLEGLRKAMDGSNMCSTMEICKLRSGKGKNMRIFLQENKSVVERACLLGHFDMLELFLLHGCSSNLPTSHGRLIHTVLISLKAHRGLIDSGLGLSAIRQLLSLDCDVDVKNYQGKSPLLLAAELADAPIMAEILARCLPWQLTTAMKDNGHTPLHMACMNGSVTCVQLLLSHMSWNADIDVGDCLNLSPLMCSMMVLKHNISFHSKAVGSSSLHEPADDVLMRVQYSHIAIVEILLHRGARPSGSAAPSSTLSGSTSSSSTYITRSEHRSSVSHQLSYRSAIHIALEAADHYSYIQSELLGKSTAVGKISSPYAELVRMLVYRSGMIPFSDNEYEVWAKAHPYITALFCEIKSFLLCRDSNPPHPPKLLTLCRNVIRFESAKADMLSQLKDLPLPANLKDFLNFHNF